MRAQDFEAIVAAEDARAEAARWDVLTEQVQQ